MEERDTIWRATWHERPRSAARYRDRVQKGRPPRRPRGRLRYTDPEWTVLCRVAAAAGMRPGAWAQQAALDAAVAVERGGREHREVVEDLLDEIRTHRRLLANIGGLANQLAAAANATGEVAVADEALDAMDLVRRVVHTSDTLTVRIRTHLLPDPYHLRT